MLESLIAFLLQLGQSPYLWSHVSMHLSHVNVLSEKITSRETDDCMKELWLCLSFWNHWGKCYSICPGTHRSCCCWPVMTLCFLFHGHSFLSVLLHSVVALLPAFLIWDHCHLSLSTDLLLFVSPDSVVPSCCLLLSSFISRISTFRGISKIQEIWWNIFFLLCSKRWCKPTWGTVRIWSVPIPIPKNKRTHHFCSTSLFLSDLSFTH